jgi:hypothetical protein
MYGCILSVSIYIYIRNTSNSINLITCRFTIDQLTDSALPCMHTRQCTSLTRFPQNMTHTEDRGCGSSTGSGTPYVMSRSTDGSGYATWSTCSNAGLASALSKGRFSCLANHGDLGNAELTEAVCGNGIREGIEECDCLFGDCTGVDACCDATTCKLYANAECSEQVRDETLFVCMYVWYVCMYVCMYVLYKYIFGVPYICTYGCICLYQTAFEPNQPNTPRPYTFCTN